MELYRKWMVMLLTGSLLVLWCSSLCLPRDFRREEEVSDKFDPIGREGRLLMVSKQKGSDSSPQQTLLPTTCSDYSPTVPAETGLAFTSILRRHGSQGSIPGIVSPQDFPHSTTPQDYPEATTPQDSKPQRTMNHSPTVPAETGLDFTSGVSMYCPQDYPQAATGTPRQAGPWGSPFRKAHSTKSDLRFAEFRSGSPQQTPLTNPCLDLCLSRDSQQFCEQYGQNQQTMNYAPTVPAEMGDDFTSVLSRNGSQGAIPDIVSPQDLPQATALQDYPEPTTPQDIPETTTPQDCKPQWTMSYAPTVPAEMGDNFTSGLSRYCPQDYPHAATGTPRQAGPWGSSLENAHSTKSDLAIESNIRSCQGASGTQSTGVDDKLTKSNEHKLTKSNEQKVMQGCSDIAKLARDLNSDMERVRKDRVNPTWYDDFYKCEGQLVIEEIEKQIAKKRTTLHKVLDLYKAIPDCQEAAEKVRAEFEIWEEFFESNFAVTVEESKRTIARNYEAFAPYTQFFDDLELGFSKIYTEFTVFVRQLLETCAIDANKVYGRKHHPPSWKPTIQHVGDEHDPAKRFRTSDGSYSGKIEGINSHRLLGNRQSGGKAEVLIPKDLLGKGAALAHSIDALSKATEKWHRDGALENNGQQDLKTTADDVGKCFEAVYGMNLNDPAKRFRTSDGSYSGKIEGINDVIKVIQCGFDWLRSMYTDAEVLTTHTMAAQRIIEEICARDCEFRDLCIRTATTSRIDARDFGENLVASLGYKGRLYNSLLENQILAVPLLKFTTEIGGYLQTLLAKLQNTPNNTDKTEAAGGATASVAAVDTLASMNRWIRGDPFARRHVYLPNDGTNNDPDECSRRYMYRVIPPYPDAQDRSESIYEDVIMTYTKGGESIKIYTPLDCPIINVASPPGPAPQG
eukprot:GHVQ01034085.1.p1 GENE.GHVQ01034085.1~~GHVQ01034085.1.p1  ORF type:complete len:906 (-),score=100.33 GHVQ01034085.1:330-3047(-)